MANKVELGVEHNLNILWVFYLLSIVDPEFKRIPNKDQLCENMVNHCINVFNNPIKKGPLDCHGMDLLIIDKIQKEYHSGTTIKSTAINIFKHFENYYNLNVQERKFQDII